MKKIKEKHISVSDTLHERIKKVAKITNRTMRGALEQMVLQAEGQIDACKGGQ